MEQIKVTAVLLDGRISTEDGCISLDAILYSAYAKKYHTGLKGVQFDLKDAIDFPLPIQRINEASADWYYDCSYALFQKLKTYNRMYNKRFDETLATQYLDKACVIETRKGQFKNYRNALRIILTNEITWYLTADKQEVKSLLSYVKAIGKGRKQGVGWVKEWNVESTKECLSHLRAIPDQNGSEIAKIRPPYFNQYNERHVTIPDDDRIGYVQMFRL